MKKLSAIIRYECTTSIKYIWIYYGICLSVVALIYLIAGISTGSFAQVGTNCLELNSMIYVGILGVLGFKEDFRMLIQNGFTRKYIYIATFALFAFISGIMALVDTIVGNVLHFILSSGYESLFGVLYGYDYSVFINWLWLFFAYMLICSLFYLAILIINKIGKTLSIYLGVGLGAVALLIPALLGFVFPSQLTKELLEFAVKGIGFMADGTINFVYPFLLLIVLVGILSAGSYLVIRKTEIKR